MAIQLQKKVPVSLTKVSGGPKKFTAALGWNPATANGHSIDLDLSLFMMAANGKLVSDAFFIFYNNPTSPDGAAHYPGDSRAGEGDGDDEVIEIDLNRIDSRVEFLYFAVTIDQAEARGHHFGHVADAYIRLRNSTEVVCEYRLNETYTHEDSLIIASITRNNGNWHVEAIGQAFAGGLATLVDMYQ
ncbi:TerD family protein [Hufsiella ginkgonis]|uniref:Chemical-damaging agent resistance protein C n=1 Tax=Hufsiella ginkgonis TaxID=2695274 RepID=A0A7K1XTK0_9SPHI|nr:TerD family protein [Hufsiella ginkgonis]MXV14294.1 chemical-damaging agent resistance protein C [Hufsiella ginkgonis]